MKLKTNEIINIYGSVYKSDFKAFVRKVFNEVSPNSQYLDNWHVDVICNELMKVTDDKNNQNRLIINIPPRHMKSIICSVAFPAFILGNNPKASIICVSYSDELAAKFFWDSNWLTDNLPRSESLKMQIL